MTRRPGPKGLSYPEMQAALDDAYRSILGILQMRLSRNVREALGLLERRLAAVLRRDDGRTR